MNTTRWCINRESWTW